MRALLVVVMVVAGFAQAKPAPKPATFNVTIDATKFEPAILNVKTGDRIVFTNKDMFPHTATSKSGGFDSGRLEPGQSWTLVAKKKGAFELTCTYHPTMGGTLRVR